MESEENNYHRSIPGESSDNKRLPLAESFSLRLLLINPPIASNFNLRYVMIIPVIDTYPNMLVFR